MRLVKIKEISSSNDGQSIPIPVQYASHICYVSLASLQFDALGGRVCAALMFSSLSWCRQRKPQASNSGVKRRRFPASCCAQCKSAVKPEPKKAKEAYKRGLRAEQAEDWKTAHEDYADAVDWAPTDREYLLRRETAKSHLVQAKVDLAERDAVSGRLKEARRELIAAAYLDPTNRVVRDRLTELTALEPDTVSSAPKET